MAEPPPPTVLAHKTAFLTAQTLQLSQPLAPSQHWQRSNADSDAASLSQKTLEDALTRLNHLLQQHSRRVYAPQASRHVAEQIERLLLDSADRYIAGRRQEGEDGGDKDGADIGDDALRIGADLTTHAMISSLPENWFAAYPAQAEAHPAEAQRYQDLAASLTSLSARRTQASQRVERLRKMKALLQPFSTVAQNEQAESSGAGGVSGSSVQENLITRNGDVEKELERMRMLLVRVSGRLAQLPPSRADRSGADVRMRNARDHDADGEEDDFVQDLDVLERNKVASLLDGF
ncbi:kinetochore complex Fta4 of Sim4 subunit, or CENP-50-domain-containing protein [Microdochium trichocladiopsis]|uniref:Kinetochore complex Fta4 of Sim4 subunit, or CENP-50-domain-containing protein n=1 Tax=Microdochium trichocladiopsis TaxID=1682393 RepID=A0A9P8Y0V7_9PEZI|nr:kinetochore complex Fta4 of Sim4 subunit, or CENP-50-domain-containing protein [Microdochium trichocladiopsis]KAH7026436.1 kinetochore complex Fta4 of Sim4 subunit, or CENP-50-domain-containing protein [Microdochium trichocladiopsis]